MRRVTDTLHSKHILGLACDVYAAEGESNPVFYDTIAAIARRYNITHPLASPPLVDLPHFEFSKVGPKPIQENEATRKRALERLKDGLSGKVLQRFYLRLKKRFYTT